MSDTKAEAVYYEPCVEVICLCGNDFVYNTQYRDYGECDKCKRRYAYTGELKEITQWAWITAPATFGHSA